MALRSPEDQVYDAVLRRLAESPSCYILSAHPPSGKAYDSELIRLRARKKAGRYHVDIIAVLPPAILLIELKGALSQSGGDINKLRNILIDYPPQVLVPLLAKRVAAGRVAWDQLHIVVAMLGVAKVDTLPPYDLAVVAGNDVVKATLVSPGTLLGQNERCMELVAKAFAPKQ